MNPVESFCERARVYEQDESRTVRDYRAHSELRAIVGEVDANL